MSDEEYERFEITDYDLENEFNPRSKGLTKNQQIYGVWAENESDCEEEDTKDTRPSFSTGRKAKNYAAPIGFIAGGIQQAGKPKEQKEVDNKNLSDDDDQRFNLRNLKAGSSSSEDEGPVARFGKSRGRELPLESEIAGLRKRGYKPPNLILSQRGMGTWEKHTKGIGTKLLLQMGYQPGKGLGKDLQGIETPIEAKLRKGRGAVGAYGPEVHQKVMAKVEEKKVSKKEGSEDKISQWRRGEKAKKSKYVVKTMEEVLNRGEIPGRRREFNELSKVKVIDMTGPEQRVLSGYHAISGVQKPSEQWEVRKEKQFANFDLPELLHNLDLLVDMCEQEIVTSDKTIKYNEDRLIALEAEMNKLEQLTFDEGKVADALEHLTNTLENLMESSAQDSISLEDITLNFQRLKESYPNEYFLYEIGSAAPDILKKPLQERLKEWQPLKDPEGPINLFTQWRLLLEMDLGRAPPTPLHDPYYRLLWETWMPVIRPLVLNWDCKTNYASLVDLIEIWKSLLPVFIYDNILQQLVLPRIQQSVEDWNPLTDTIPIHTWTQPWIPFIGGTLGMSIFPVIRQKLGNALNNWYPSDSSARFMLLPWLGVFPRQEMEAFLITHILPKLALCVQEINPQQQNTEPWSWVISWLPLVGDNLVAELLDKSFFPRWLQALTLWLNMAPNYDQISNWYTGWKQIIPEQLREHPKIKGHLRNALELMSRSVGGPQPPPPPPPPDISSHSRYQGMAEAVRTANQMIEGFRDLISKRCEERGIVFVPLPNRYRESKQVYRCGSVQIYLDRNVIFYLEHGSMWQPIGLSALLDKASLL